MTALDDAHAAMEAGGDAERLAFYSRLGASELYLLMEGEAPAVFETSEGRFVLAFDGEDRLAAFAGGPAPYAALSGRGIAAMLAGADTGLGLNFGAPSETLLSAGSVAWLNDTLAEAPDEAEDRPETIAPPSGLPERVVTALDQRLAAAGELARLAYLVGVGWPGGRQGHLLAVIDAAPGAEPALARAIREALVFSGVEAGTLDVAFFSATDPIAAQLARHGLRFDLPERPQTRPPGSDPTKPPKLQ
jgi:hypothetical protein